MKGIENMTKEEQLNHAIVKMAQLSELLLQQRKSKDFTDLGKVEFTRRFDIVAEFLFTCHQLWEDEESLKEFQELQERSERKRIAYVKKEQDEKDKEILRLSAELQETKKKNSSLFLALTRGGKNGIQHNRQN